MVWCADTQQCSKIPHQTVMTAFWRQRRGRKLVHTNLGLFLSFLLLIFYFGIICCATRAPLFACFCSLCTILLMYNTYVLRIKLFILTNTSSSREKITQRPQNFYDSLFEMNEIISIMESTYAYKTHSVLEGNSDLLSGQCEIITHPCWKSHSHQSIARGSKIMNISLWPKCNHGWTEISLHPLLYTDQLSML